MVRVGPGSTTVLVPPVPSRGPALAAHILYRAISLLGSVPGNEGCLPPERDAEVPQLPAPVTGVPGKQT